MSPVIKLEQDQQDEDRELEIELDYQSTLTTAQRFEMMFCKSRELVIELLKRGYRKPVEIVKRA
jgi:uncharacterized membrane protein